MFRPTLPFLLCLLLFVVGLSGAASAAAQGVAGVAQTLTGEGEPKPKARAAETDIESRLAALRERLRETQDRLRAVETLPTLPPGANAEEAEERLQLLQRSVRAYQIEIDTLVRLQQLRQSRKDLESDGAGQILTEPPPYAIEVVDGLWAKVLAKQAEIETTENNRRIAESLQADARGALEQAEQSLRLAREKLEQAQDKEAPDRDRLRWLFELAELRRHLAQIALTGLEADRQLLDESLAQQRVQLAFTRDRAESAARDSPLSEADRDRMLAAIEKRRAEVRGDIRKAAASLRAAQDAVEQARERLRNARSQAPEDRLASDAQLRRLDALQARLDAQKALAETATLRLDSLRPLEEGLTLEAALWQQRQALAEGGDPDQLTRARAQIRANLERLAVLKQQTLSRLNATYPLVDGQRKYIAGLSEQNGELRLAQLVLASYEQRIQLFQTLLSGIEALDGLARRWREEIELYRAAQPVTEQLESLVYALGQQLGDLWLYEVFAAEDTIVVDGETITGKRSVTVSKIVTVLLVLIIGLWVAGRLARMLRWFLWRRRRMHANSVILSYRLVHIGIVLALIFFALNAFKIPFTVFAFLGGALAIGLGFGAQNLINNFISGLILLIERPVQLGDIVEVEGVRGKVAAIGARYSEIRRFDGIDILIPNSALLENNVTNWTLSDRRIRLSVSMRIGYGTATDRVTALIQQAADEHPKVLRDPAPVVLLEDFGESAMLFSVYFWVLLNPDEDHRIVASDLRYDLERLFAAAGIVMPYPQRDLHLHADQPLRIAVEDPAAEPARARAV